MGVEGAGGDTFSSVFLGQLERKGLRLKTIPVNNDEEHFSATPHTANWTGPPG